MYKYIFLDIDGTLLDFEKCAENALNKTLDVFGVKHKGNVYPLYSKINSSYWKKLEKKEVTLPELRINRFVDFFEILETEVDIPAFNTMYNDNLSLQHVMMDGCIEILEYLKEKYILCVVTNGISSTQHSRLSVSGLEKYFDYLFISQEIGVNKPDIGFFEHCFKTANIKDKSEVLLIGDSLSSDMQGAKNAGIDKCWFNPEGVICDKDIIFEYEIKSLYEIKDIL